MGFMILSDRPGADYAMEKQPQPTNDWYGLDRTAIATVCTECLDQNSHSLLTKPQFTLLLTIYFHPEVNSDQRGSMTSTPSKDSQSLGQGKRQGLGSKDTQAAVSANTEEERGARTGASPRDADAAAPP